MRTLIHLVVYVVVAVFLTAGAEWQNNVLMNYDIRGWSGYRETLTLNAVLALFAYGTFTFFRRRFPLTKLLVAQYTLWGVIGLAFEWLLIGHNPFSEALQFGMFVYWAGVFATPMLFILPETSRIRIPLFSYIIGATALLVVGSLMILGERTPPLADNDPIRGWLLAFIIIGWQFIYTPLIGFFFRACNQPMRIAWLIALAVVAPLAEILTSALIGRPFNFLAFLIVIALCYRFILKKKAVMV